MRGWKNPGTPASITAPACAWLTQLRAASVNGTWFHHWPMPKSWVVLTCSQKLRSFATRSRAGLPAMMRN